MPLDRRTIRLLIAAGLVLAPMAVAMLFASGALKTLLFVIVAGGGTAICMVVWPEALMMAYLFAGRYTYERRLAPGDLPISANQLLLIALAVLALIHGRHVLSVLRSVSGALLIGFSSLLLLGLAWTLGPEYGMYKVSRTWIVVVPAILVTAALVERRRSFLPLVAAMFAIGFALNSAGLLTFQASLHGTHRLGGLGSGPNVFSRTVGLSLLIAVLVLTHRFQQGVKTRKDWITVIGAGGAVLWLLPGFVFAQSRGPVLAFIVALLVVVTMSLFGNWRTVIAGVAGLMFTYFAGSAVVSQVFSHSRFDLSRESNLASMEVRLDYLWDTWDMVIANPLLGVGTGGWPVQIYGIDHRGYPHNFFVEIAAENGLPMALLILGVFAAVIVRGGLTWGRSEDPNARFMLLSSIAVFFFFAINIQVSGDTIDNRLIWLGLLAVELSTRFALEAMPAVSRSAVRPEAVPVGFGPRSPVP